MWLRETTRSRPCTRSRRSRWTWHSASGFRIPATVGTDVFLNRIGSNLPGGDRVYVRGDGPLNYEKWIEGLKAGRSFVTSGPMLEFAVNGDGPGAVLKLVEKPAVRVKATARFAFPLAKAEVIHNGNVVATAALSEDKRTATVDSELSLEQGGRLAFRVSGPGTADTATSAPSARTNPVYVEAGRATYRSPNEAEAFLKWIDQLHLVLRASDRIPTPKHREQTQDQLDAARAVYFKTARGAK